MSTLLPSDSPRPLLMIGTTLCRPPPVEFDVVVGTPVAVRLTHASRVKVLRPRLGAAPKVT